MGLTTIKKFSWNECVFIYCTYHIVSQGGLQFYLSEIGRQLVKAPLAAAISPYLISLTHPACNTEDAGDGAYGLLSLSKKT